MNANDLIEAETEAVNTTGMETLKDIVCQFAEASSADPYEQAAYVQEFARRIRDKGAYMEYGAEIESDNGSPYPFTLSRFAVFHRFCVTLVDSALNRLFIFQHTRRGWLSPLARLVHRIFHPPVKMGVRGFWKSRC